MSKAERFFFASLGGTLGSSIVIIVSLILDRSDLVNNGIILFIGWFLFGFLMFTIWQKQTPTNKTFTTSKE